MTKLSYAALVLPLKIIFANCQRRGSFPEIRKYAIPVHKKDKKLKGNYRPISLLPIFGKIFENSYTTEQQSFEWSEP